MAVDRVKPLKLESPDSGGVETDEFPTSLDVSEDFVDCRGVTIQDDTSNDDLVCISRDGDDMTFLDKNNTVKTLTALTSGGFDPNTIVWDLEGRIVYTMTDEMVLTT